jgi:dienelactone hydrolase
VTLAVCVVAIAVAAFVALDRGGERHDSGAARIVTAPTTAVAPASTAPTALPTTTPPSALDVDRRYAVGVHDVTYVDASRPTSPNGGFAGAPTRTLPTTIWYPAGGDPAAAPARDAPPPSVTDRFPLVLFAHGYNVTPAFYAPLLERWAAAGYVVAAPTFPILSGAPGGVSHVDYDRTPGDASFVITSILGAAGSDPVAALVDPARIAAAGHSDGEVVALALGMLPCCRDLRVKAVIPMAGDLGNAGSPLVRDSGVPVLHIMETNDEYDPYPDSVAWDRANLTAPRWIMTLEGASHVPPYTQPGNPYFELVAATTVDFLDGTLKDRPDRLDRVTADVAAQPSLAAIER